MPGHYGGMKKVGKSVKKVSKPMSFMEKVRNLVKGKTPQKEITKAVRMLGIAPQLLKKKIKPVMLKKKINYFNSFFYIIK